MYDPVICDGIDSHCLLRVGHRSRARYARHASSVARFASNSIKNYADTLPPPPPTRCWAYLSQGDTQQKSF